MQTVKLQQSNVEERKSIAREQSAMFPTQLALARWTGGAEPGQLNHLYPPQRAAWLARAQGDFQAWLEAGGFVQHDEPANDAGVPPDDESAYWGTAPTR
jgi:hypothetical protein